MAVRWEDMTETERNALQAILGQQRLLQELADVEYTCYYLKIDVAEFYKRFLNLDNWDYIIKKYKEVNNG